MIVEIFSVLRFKPVFRANRVCAPNYRLGGEGSHSFNLHDGTTFLSDRVHCVGVYKSKSMPVRCHPLMVLEVAMMSVGLFIRGY